MSNATNPAVTIYNFDTDIANSADGLCAIDADHAIGAVTDAAKNAEISTAAKQVLDTYVLCDGRKRLKRMGGIIKGIGECDMCVICAFPPPSDESVENFN